MLHTFRLITFCFHIIVCDGIGSHRHRTFRVQQIVLRFIFSDKLLNVIILQKLHILDCMAGDKTILADHDRQSHILMFGNAVSLYHIVIGFLIVLRIDLDPSGIPCAHTVRMITVNIDRS